MSTKPKPRIPRDIPGFDLYISNTDDRQLAINPATTQPYWKGYGWTIAESADWTNFRTISNGLYDKYKNKTTQRTTEVTDNLHLNIEACIKYDNDPVDGHGLLDMVARKGEAADWLIFNVKKGTALEDKTKTPAEDPGTKVPGLSISEVGHLYHVLTITNPDAPTSKAKPKGIKDIQVYRALVADGAPAPADSDYEYIGDASRGRFISEFDSADVKKIAWYKARYENTLGKTGNFCNPESETVI